MKSEKRYSIGIDLGTTNCVLSYIDPSAAGLGPQILPVTQWEEAGSLNTSETLPSFAYLAPKAEREAAFSRGGAPPPFEGGWLPGIAARSRMATHPGRVIHSAKSWLSHAAVDRTAPILPWQSEEVSPGERLSPVQASAAYLSWLRNCWNAEKGSEDPKGVFDAQDVVVTVPASFDEGAQRLTLEAAKLAGFPEVRLIEEPQAAFYDWLGRGRNASRLLDLLESTEGGIARILVCDIGGGTTDFSLFEARADKSAPGGLSLRRVAVSDHLLLGGDNIDLTLAYLLEERLTGGKGRLSGRQLGQLLAQARDLKERILREETAPETEFPVVLAGAGAGLFASTKSARIRAEEVHRIVLEGFFPECGADDRPRRQGGGLREWGLPYAADTAVTRHLAGFLEGRTIDAVLFNGGTVTPEFLRTRLHRLIAGWQEKAPIILANDAPALSVARGAARYGWLLSNPQKGGRIAGGHAHALYLEVVRGKEKGERSLVCVLPRGMEAGETAQIDNAEFDLRVNQPVRFQCHFSRRREGDAAGSVVPWNERDFHSLPPLQTAIHLPSERPRPANDRLRVSLESSLNELGIFQLWCVEENGPGRWRLDFNLRRGIEDEEPVQAPEAPLVPEAQLRQARDLLQAVYGKKKDPNLPDVTPRQLPRRLEEVLGGPRDGWDSATLRALWPELAQGMGRRARSPEHEANWLFLAGWFLRPGYGFELDEARIEELWRLFAQGMAHPKEKRVQAQWHILWRRVAGGLNAARQEKVLEKLLPTLQGGEHTSEMIYLSGSLERLHQGRKLDLVKLLSTGLRRPRLKTREPYAWALGRLLTRTPLYAGPDAVLSPSEVEALFARVRDFDWRTPDYSPLNPLFSLAARRTDKRGVDLTEEARREILAKMKESGAHPEQMRVVRETVPVEYADRVRQFGDSLPAGLILVG